MFTLAACGEPGQLLDASLASGIRITEVTATTSVTRAETALPKEQIVEAARAKVAAALQSGNQSGSRAVRAEVEVVQFYIANAVAGVLLGGNRSSINTKITLVDVSTGEAIREPFTVFGITETRPTVLGAASIKSPAEELTIITDDLARRARIAVYGN
ncbi:hypothetical protein [uncultured Sulfitobacter sp.]|uniref:hypothetical protein n=1 Tax=uncultured Sulfitobacter sp. TaxID=191468 RepID=UPI0026386133|nr:hypothetical protein [uncultured Sulfitobacter sp.]